MSLAISYDIQGSYITNPAWSLTDSLARGRGAEALTLSGVSVAPNALGEVLQPINLTPAWASAPGKWGLADFLPPPATGAPAPPYEAIEHRAAGDWFLASKGLADGARIPTAAAVARNGGLFLEFFCYAAAHTRIPDVVILEFGQYFSLHLHSDGTADLADGRPGAPAPYLARGRDLTAGGQDLAGKFVGVLVLPWRRGRILVASSQGGWFEVYAGDTTLPEKTGSADLTPGEAVYHQTTPAAQAALTFSPQARAFGALNPLRYPLTGSIASPLITPPNPVDQPPTSQAVLAEQQDGTAVTLTLLDGDGSDLSPVPGSPADQVQYALTLTAPDSGAGYALVTPQVFGLSVDWDRETGQRAYTTNAIPKIVDGRLVFSRDRGQKSLTLTLDNPGDEWTSLKDLWNRNVSVSISPDGADAGAAAATLFVGQGDPADFLDGVASRITLNFSGRRKRLRAHLLTDSRAYDGWEHGQSVYQVLHEAGIPDEQIVVVHDGVALDSADPGDDPLWLPANGTSADEWVQHVADTFSGWVFDDIGGIYYYVPQGYFTAAALAGESSVPQVYLATPTDGITDVPAPGAEGPNPSILVALDGSVRQPPATEPQANDIWVLGQDPDTDEVIAAHYVDEDSIANRLAFNYVGERRMFIYASASITSDFMAQRALGVFASRLPLPVRTVAFSLPDYQWAALPLEGPLYLHGYGVALVSAVDARLDCDRYRLSEYTVELLPD